MTQYSDPRRKHPRKRYDRPIKCITTSMMFDCMGVNLSSGGVCLRSPVPLENGDELALLVPIGNGESRIVIALGKVVWIKDLDSGLNDFPVYAGIQFMATANKFRPQLDKLCLEPD